jgi:4-hydroxybenzoyl-CoA thioesterase
VPRFAGIPVNMFSIRRMVRIEWGDCDPAGIVFYPRYFAMFNHSTELLVEQALGIKKFALNQLYQLGGYPAVATQARFLLPTRYGDDVEIESTVTKVGQSSFSVQHRLSLDATLAVEGNETRVWAVRDDERPGGLRSQPMPEQLASRLKGD